MGFKEVNAVDSSVSISLGGINRTTGKPNPTQIEGYYLGVKAIPSLMAKSGSTNLYILQTPKGNVGVWGKTDLDRKMLGVDAEAGYMIRISYTGTKPIPGKNSMHTFKVEVDESNTLNAEEFNAATAADDSGFEDDVPTNFDEVEPEYPVAAQAAATTNPAKARALLSKTAARK